MPVKRAYPQVSIYDLAPSFNVSLWYCFHPFFNPRLLDLKCHSCLYHKTFKMSTDQACFSKIVPFASRWQCTYRATLSALFFVLVRAWLSISVWGVCPRFWTSGVQGCWSQLYKLQSGVKGNNRRHMSLWQQPLRWHMHHLVWRLGWTCRTSLDKYLPPIRTGWVFACMHKYIHLCKINCRSYDATTIST